MCGDAYLPMAKILDIWGNSEASSLIVFLGTIGLILDAFHDKIQIFSAAQVGSFRAQSYKMSSPAFTSASFTEMILDRRCYDCRKVEVEEQGLCICLHFFIVYHPHLY